MHMLPFLSIYADARDEPEHDENVVLNTFLQSENRAARGPVCVSVPERRQVTAGVEF
jgi:hypothetical protein